MENCEKCFSKRPRKLHRRYCRKWLKCIIWRRPIKSRHNSIFRRGDRLPYTSSSNHYRDDHYWLPRRYASSSSRKICPRSQRRSSRYYRHGSSLNLQTRSFPSRRRPRIFPQIWIPKNKIYWTARGIFPPASGSQDLGWSCLWGWDWVCRFRIHGSCREGQFTQSLEYYQCSWYADKFYIWC